MKSHPLGVRTIYEIYRNGKLRYSNESFHQQENIVEVRINNPGMKEQILRFPFRSYVSNFMRVLNYSFLEVDNSTSGLAINKIIKTTAGGATYCAAEIAAMAVNEGQIAHADATLFGIWIGDKYNTSRLGLTVETAIQEQIGYDNYRLRTLIIPDGGSPDTNVVYGATNVLISNGDDTLTVKRRFNNTGAVTISIDEIGLVGKSGSDYFLLARDAVTNPGITGAFALVAGGTCEVSYTFSITNASGWTRNYLRMLSSEFVGGNTLSAARDINNTAYTVNFTGDRTTKDLLAAAENSNFGIVVGADTAPDANPMYDTSSINLLDRIAHGTAYGQLSYGPVLPIDLTQVNNNTIFGLRRDFERGNTVGTFYPHSSGLIIRAGTDPYIYFLLGYDYIPSAGTNLELLPGEILRVKYLFEARK